LRAADRFIRRLLISRFIILCAAASFSITLAGCAKQEPLTFDKAKEVLEASNLFRPQLANVTLTDDEVQKGLNAGYWTLSAEAEHHRENHRMLLLTPEGRHYFSGQPLLKRPVITLKQELSGRLLQVEDVQVPGEGATDRVVVYTYTWNFANQIPELAEMFKDHPAEEAKKTFRYETDGWKILQ
jgi:hypothetical protein